MTDILLQEVATVWFRLRAEAEDVILASSLDGPQWPQIHMAHLAECAGARSASGGRYAYTSKAAGFEAELSFLSVVPGRLPAAGSTG